MQEHDEDIRGSLGGKFESWEQAPPADGLARLQADLSNRQGMPRWALWWPVAVLLLGTLSWLVWPDKGTKTPTELATATPATEMGRPQNQDLNAGGAASQGATETNSTAAAPTKDATAPAAVRNTESSSIETNAKTTEASHAQVKETAGLEASSSTKSNLATRPRASAKTVVKPALQPAIAQGGEKTKADASAEGAVVTMPEARTQEATSVTRVAKASGAKAKTRQVRSKTTREQILERALAALAAERRKTDSLNELVQTMRASMLTLESGMKAQEVKLAAQAAELNALVAAKEAQENQMAEYVKATSPKAKAEDSVQKKAALSDSTQQAEKPVAKVNAAMKGRLGMAMSGYYTRQHTVATSAHSYEVVSASTPNAVSPERMAIGLEAIYTQPVSTRVQLRLGMGAFWQQSAQTLGITEGQLAHTLVSTQNNTTLYTPVHQVNALNIKQQYAHVMGSAGVLFKPWAERGFYLHGGMAAYYQAWGQQRVQHNGNGLTNTDVERLYGTAPNHYLNMSLQCGFGYEMPFGRAQRLAFEPEYRFMLAPQTFGNRMVQTTPHFMGIKVVYGW